MGLGYLGASTEGFQAYGETNERGTFTMYYADWCPHCKSAKPIFKDFMGSGIVQVNGQPIRVRMVEEKEHQKGVDPDVKGYPSFLYSDSAGRVVEFNGPRNAEGFMKFLEEQILS
jgi:thiol-disulfide isomerase/thioredoxin